MLGNAVEFVVLTAALDLMGAVTVPLSPATTDAEMNMLLELTPLRVVISHPRSGGPRDTGPGVDRYQRPVERRRLRGTLLQVALYGVEPRPVELPVRPHAAFPVSGAGGATRVVLRTAENLAAEVENLALKLEFGVEDRVVSSVPLHTAQGFQVAMLLPVGYGGMLFLEDNLAPRNLVRLVRQGGVTVLPMWPGLLCSLNRYTALGVPWPKDMPVKMVSFRSTSTSALKLPHPKLGGRTAVRALHLPETGTICMDEDGGGSPASVGEPLSGVEILVGAKKKTALKQAGSAGRGKRKGPAKPRGKSRTRATVRSSGRLQVRGLAVSEFTLQSGVEEPVRLTDEDGFVDTGCRVRMDNRERITLAGRADDLLELEGAWISLEEVGQAFMTHPAVKDVEFSVAQAPDSGEPLLAARVKASGKVDSTELVRHASRALSPLKVPAKVEVVR
jgi:acyl-CoA synthetase (AMP-forming)/AMP-acid ligase II